VRAGAIAWLKVHDGADRARGAITIAVLRELGLVSDIAVVPHLARHERPIIENHAKRPTGEIVAAVPLRREA
jgi:L-asparaginase II